MSDLQRELDQANDDFLALECQLAEARARLEWQPIESAPKDGTQILLFAITDTETSNYKIDSGSWHVGVGCWIWEGRKYREGALPTHWMPLPEPPEEAQSPKETTR